MNQNFRNFALWIVILLLLVALFNLFQSPSTQSGASDITYSQFRSETIDGRIRSVTISGQEITGTYTDGSRFRTIAPEGTDYVRLLEDRGVSIQARASGDDMSFLSVLISWFPMLLLIAVWIFFMRQMQGAGGRAMGFGKSKAKLLTEAHGRVTFEDVAGVDEAKEDLQEIVEFLRDPQKFTKLGGRLPKGALLSHHHTFTIAARSAGAFGLDQGETLICVLPLFHAALGMAHLCDPPSLPEKRAQACRKITAAMSAYPEMVSGYGEFDEQLMRAAEGRIITKRGAEGFQIVGVLPGVIRPDSPGLGIALKVSDGEPARMADDLTFHNRVRPAVTLEILRQLGALSSKQEQVLVKFGPVKEIRNHRGIVTGQSRPVFEL